MRWDRDKHETGLSTLCVHGGENLDAQGGIHASLYNHSTFGFPSTEALLDVVEGRVEGNLYTRYGLNPTIPSVLRLFTIAASLGGADSLVTQPITTTHHDMTREERQRRGNVDGMVRLSCGLEDSADLIADLKQALD